MRTLSQRVLFMLSVGLGLTAPRAAAECGAITFEEYAVGTPITTQYAGVEFSTVNSGCPAAPPVIEIAPPPGTVSPTHVLANPHNCGDVTSEIIVITFEQAESEISFALGLEGVLSVSVRAYTVQVGGAPVITRTVNVPVSFGVFRQVRLAAAGMRRVEIGAVGSNNTIRIDDLRYSFRERPQAEISFPADNACLCGDAVEVRGIACDPNGLYARDRLEFQPYPSPPGASWTLVSEAASPVCVEGGLYDWNISLLPEGSYKLLLTVENDCGYSRSAVVVVHVDRSFDMLEVREPTAAFTYGGDICFDGTANDECFDFYEVEWAPAGSGGFAAIDPPRAPYETAVINDPLGTWDTSGRPDGDYTVRLTGTTTCGNSRSITRSIRLDNTPPIAEITSPTYCAHVHGVIPVIGRVIDDSLTQWVLEYSQAGTGAWVTIAIGNTQVPSGNSILANWDTTGLPRCAYMLRLRAHTRTIVDCDDDTQTAEDRVAVSVGCAEDIDGNGAIELADLALLLSAFGTLCP